MLVYPPEGHVTDSCTVFFLGSASLFCNIGGQSVSLCENGNFSYIYNLELGENRIEVNIDGESISRTVHAILTKSNSLPLAYARPYKSFSNSSDIDTQNILRSILVEKEVILIPLLREPEYFIKKIDAHTCDLLLLNVDIDLDWIYYEEIDPVFRIYGDLNLIASCGSVSEQKNSRDFTLRIHSKISLDSPCVVFENNYLRLMFKELR